MEHVDIIPSIVISAHALARIAAREAREEAPAAQWRVLSILEQSSGIRVGALATAARTTQPGMTRLVGELDRAGLVDRSRDPNDSRATVVDITDAGRDALRQWRSRFRATLAPRFSDLDEEDWRVLARAARILAAHTDEEPVTRAGAPA